MSSFLALLQSPVEPLPSPRDSFIGESSDLDHAPSPPNRCHGHPPTDLPHFVTLTQQQIQQERKWPCDLDQMTTLEISLEKSLLQRHLLQIEHHFGRCFHGQKHVVRPLYDRYRKVKMKMRQEAMRVLGDEEMSSLLLKKETLLREKHHLKKCPSRDPDFDKKYKQVKQALKLISVLIQKE